MDILNRNLESQQTIRDNMSVAQAATLGHTKPPNFLWVQQASVGLWDGSTRGTRLTTS